MSPTFLTIYVLIFPVIVAAVLFVGLWRQLSQSVRHHSLQIRKTVSRKLSSTRSCTSRKVKVSGIQHATQQSSQLGVLVRAEVHAEVLHSRIHNDVFLTGL